MKKFVAAVLLFALSAAHAFSRTEEPALRIVFMGDSITDGGWGNSGGSAMPSAERNQTDINHIYGHSFMFLCASQLESDYPQLDYHMWNRGISGDDISRIASRWQEDVMELKPELLSFLEGANDVHYFLERDDSSGFDFERWEKAYRDLVEQTLSDNPSIVIFLCTPFTAPSGWVGRSRNYPQREETIDEMAGRIRQMAVDYKATLVDFNSLFKELCSQPEGPSHWSWDGIHPTPAGHRRMADLWLNTYIKTFNLK